ncbi:MAG: adenylyltransferase/cytidyltransferase family protein [Firmicutes bacterium]|nr:adenylyltransferase/cytidyltransferase family protein [Bacillota bacterium]
MSIILDDEEGRAELEKLVGEWRASQRKIVFTNGCFDLLHAGHLRIFLGAKQLGDLLLVGLNSDNSVKSLKGAARPVVSENYRAELVAALKPVDYVVIFNQLTTDHLLEIVRPAVYVKGGDYTPENLPEYGTLSRLKIQVVFFPLLPDISTTKLISKMSKVNLRFRARREQLKKHSGVF